MAILLNLVKSFRGCQQRLPEPSGNGAYSVQRQGSTLFNIDSKAFDMLSGIQDWRHILTLISCYAV